MSWNNARNAQSLSELVVHVARHLYFSPACFSLSAGALMVRHLRMPGTMSPPMYRFSPVPRVPYLAYPLGELTRHLKFKCIRRETNIHQIPPTKIIPRDIIPTSCYGMPFHEVIYTSRTGGGYYLDDILRSVISQRQ